MSLTRLPLFVFLLLALPRLAFAGQAEVRDAALNNNCSPKKIEIYQNKLGGAGETLYRVTCTLPKTVGETKDTSAANSLMIACVQNLCNVVRPAQGEKK